MVGILINTVDVVGDIRVIEVDRIVVDGGELIIDEIKNYFDVRYILFMFYVIFILFYIKFFLIEVNFICLFINRYLFVCESLWRILVFLT